MYLEILILVIVTMAMRIIPRLCCPNVIPDSDTFFHLWNARYFHKYRKPHPMKWEGMDGTGYYPFLYHILLGLGGERYQRVFEVISSPLWDSIAVMSVYLFSKFVVSYSYAGVEYSDFPFWLALFYGTSPSMFSKMPGPRSFEGTARSLGETLFLLMVLLGLSPVCLPIPVWLGLGLSVIIGGLMLLASKFCLQALLFLSISAAALSNRVDLLLLPVLIILTAILISYGEYLKILKLQIAHLNTYARRTQKIMPRMMDRNNPKRIAAKVKQIWQDKQYSRLMAILAFDITPTALIYKCPQFVFAILILLGIFGQWKAPPGLGHPVFRIWFWAALFPMFFTSFYPFLFLGEAERYQNYCLFPQYVFITSYLWQHNALYWFLLIQFVIDMLYVGLFILSLRQRRYRTKQLWELVNFVDNNYPKTTIIAILREIPHEVEYYLKNSSVFPSLFNGDMNVFYKYPYIHPEKLAQFIREQGARLIVVEAQALKDMAEKHKKPYDLTPWPKKVFSNELFFILEVNKHDCANA